MDIKEKKKNLEKQLEQLNSNLNKEELEKISRKELLELVKINLEIQKNLTILQAAEDAEFI